jgi:hypothetical protein
MEDNSIVLNPDFAYLFATFAREARLQADTMLALLPEHTYNPDRIKEAQRDTLRAFQAILAPLNICTQAIHTVEAVHQYRELIAEVAATINRKATEIDNALAEYETEEL